MAMESSQTDVYMMSTVRGLVEYITAKTQLARVTAPTLAPQPDARNRRRNPRTSCRRLGATALQTIRLTDD